MKNSVLTKKLKLGVIFLFLYQIARLICLIGTVVVIIDSVVIKRQEVPIFMPGDVSLNSEERTTDTSTIYPITTTELFEFSDQDANFNAGHLAVLMMPILDILLLIYIIITITVKLSHFGIYRWTTWVLKSRLIWMRILWFLTAVIYAALYLHFRKKRYKLTNDPRYLDPAILNAQVVVLPIEYACLGITETVTRIFTCDRLNKKAKKLLDFEPKQFGTLGYMTYLIMVILFAFRNFSVSLYFGIYSAILADEDQDEWLKNVLVVIQIYLAIMRGKFFHFFLRLFLANFVVEDDSVIYDLSSSDSELNRIKTESV